MVRKPSRLFWVLFCLLFVCSLEPASGAGTRTATHTTSLSPFPTASATPSSTITPPRTSSTSATVSPPPTGSASFSTTISPPTTGSQSSTISPPPTPSPTDTHTVLPPPTRTGTSTLIPPTTTQAPSTTTAAPTTTPAPSTTEPPTPPPTPAPSTAAPDAATTTAAPAAATDAPATATPATESPVATANASVNQSAGDTNVTAPITTSPPAPRRTIHPITFLDPTVLAAVTIVKASMNLSSHFDFDGPLFTKTLFSSIRQRGVSHLSTSDSVLTKVMQFRRCLVEPVMMKADWGPAEVCSYTAASLLTFPPNCLHGSVSTTQTECPPNTLSCACGEPEPQTTMPPLPNATAAGGPAFSAEHRAFRALAKDPITIVEIRPRLHFVDASFASRLDLILAYEELGEAIVEAMQSAEMGAAFRVLNVTSRQGNEAPRTAAPPALAAASTAPISEEGGSRGTPSGGNGNGAESLLPMASFRVALLGLLFTSCSL